jgi:cytoskeletal protein CcmA (bactofilin family)
MTDVSISAVDEEQLDTILAADVEFSGTLSFKKPLMIKGRVSGSIVTESDLYVDEKAVVKADIRAALVSVKGSVEGDIAATRRAELFTTSRVTGDVTAPSIAMETGCSFNGACRMSSPAPDAS